MPMEVKTLVRIDHKTVEDLVIEKAKEVAGAGAGASKITWNPTDNNTCFSTVEVEFTKAGR